MTLPETIKDQILALEEKQREAAISKMLPVVSTPSASGDAAKWYADYVAIANSPNVDPWEVHVDVETEVDGTKTGLQLWIKRIVPIAIAAAAIFLLIKFWPAISTALKSFFARRNAMKLAQGVSFNGY